VRSSRMAHLQGGSAPPKPQPIGRGRSFCGRPRRVLTVGRSIAVRLDRVDRYHSGDHGFHRFAMSALNSIRRIRPWPTAKYIRSRLAHIVQAARSSCRSNRLEQATAHKRPRQACRKRAS
jgi:hypothetical protein